MDNTTLKPLTQQTEILHHAASPINNGTIHHLTTKNGINLHGMSTFPTGGSVFYANIYGGVGSSYVAAYGIFENGKTAPAIWVESEGVLPQVFPGMDGSPWTRIIATDKNGDFDRVIPLWNRENKIRPDAKKAIAWEFEGYLGQDALFFHSEMYDRKKPDKFHFLQWNKGIPKATKTFYLEAPGGNWVGIDHLGIMNAYCRKPDRISLHRQFSADGKVTRQREFQIELAHDAPIELHFEADSHIFQFMDGKVTHVLISPDNSVKTTHCCTIPVQEDFYSVWKPKPLGNGKWAIHFTHGGGNGWLITTQNQVLKAWIGEGENQYREILSGETFSLPFSNTVLNAVAGDGAGGCFAAFYPMTTRPDLAKEVAIAYFPD